MNNDLEYMIEDDIENEKLFDYMTKTLLLSVRFTKSASKEGRIRVNGKVVTLDYILEPEDLLEIQVTREESQNILPEDIAIDVVYEDQDLIVVNKPPLMLVHPSDNFPNGSLAAAVLFHFKKNMETSIVRFVSRLDRDTSGLILIAKNTFAHMSLARENEENKIKKTYMAVVHGQMEPLHGTIDLPIGKADDDSFRRIVRTDGQRSITHYHSLKTFKDASILELKLDTGRTHQIRVHLSHMNAPIIGDILYGSTEVELIGRQALHAKSLQFPHPRTGDIIYLDTELPEDIKDLVLKISDEEHLKL